jgi:hypothetical protein
LASVNADETTKTRPSPRKLRSHAPTGSFAMPTRRAVRERPKAMADWTKKAAVVGR